MNKMLNTIVGFNGTPIPACAKFTYKGYEVSCSTIFQRWYDVAVYDKADKHCYSAASVQDAIEWIDKEAAK